MAKKPLYKYLITQRGTLEHDVNAAAAEGYRVVYQMFENGGYVICMQLADAFSFDEPNDAKPETTAKN